MNSTVNVVPAAQPTVELVHRADLAGPVRAAISLRYVYKYPGTLVEKILIPGGPGKDRIQLAFDLKNPPVPLAFDVVLRSGEREWPIGWMNSEQFDPWDFANVSIMAQPKDFTPDHVDVVLRPSVQAGENSINITRIWGEEIVIENVPVQVQKQ